MWGAVTLRSGDLGYGSTLATTNGVNLVPAVSGLAALQKLLES